MITLKTETFYSIGEGLPYCSMLPHYKTCYEALSEHWSLIRLEHLIVTEISNLKHSLNKYDSPYQPDNKKMCDEMKELLSYLETCLVEIEKLIKQ